jgi:hypothetical protein
MSEGRPNLRQLNRVRWAIYALVALVVVLPYVLPAFQMKFQASESSRKVYERIEGLKAGTPVLLAFDFDPASQAELEPMARAVLKHCFRKGLIPVIMTHWSTGIDLDRRICETTAAECEKALHRPLQSGKDWVFLGFRPGMAMLVLKMGEDLKGAFEKDFYGQPTQAMEALQAVNSLKNMGMAVDFAAGASVNMWIAYGSDRFGFPLAAGTTAVSAPDLYPFYQSRQIVGFMGGLRGAADYESLVALPGDATRGMLAQSATHVLLAVLILGANVRFLMGRFSSRRKG